MQLHAKLTWGHIAPFFEHVDEGGLALVTNLLRDSKDTLVCFGEKMHRKIHSDLIGIIPERNLVDFPKTMF